MKYQVGDDIIVLHSNEEGKVIEIVNDKMVMIEIRGVKFPAYMDQIDFPYFYRFTKKKVVEEKKPVKKFVDDIPKEKPTPNKIKVEEGVWLSFLPKFGLDDFNDEVVELFKVYLVNKTERAYKFVYQQQVLGQTEFELKNEVLAFQDFYLHDVPFESMNDNPTFAFEFSLPVPEKKKAEYFEANVKLRAKQVFKRVEEMKETNKPVIAYELFKTYPERIAEDKLDLSSLSSKGYNVYDASKAKKPMEAARSVVDLHIEKLMNDFMHLSNFEILSLQLKEFEKWYELAVAHYLPSFVVIHGVGSGRLRDEIHDLLKSRKEVKTFINQYDPRFGYGATEIFFQY